MKVNKFGDQGIWHKPDSEERTIKEFKIELEAVLDEYFPKIEEESPEKIANKRGQALALYSTAVLLFAQALKNKEKEVVLRIRDGLQAAWFYRLDEKVVSLSNALDILKDIEEEKEVAQKKEN